MTDRLPIEGVLPEVVAAVRADGLCVLEAPPGAGKTTRVPLALMEAVQGRILMLEPRRIAARAAAERMAETLGEPVGRTVGYRIRGEAKVSRETRIEVVTEGILTRRLQSDPGLEGVGALIFDEFHERSLNADLGLALALEVRGALREDLAVVVMSATLDGEGVAEMLGGAPVVRSEGRMFPVETRWLDRPLPAGSRFEGAVADLVGRAVRESDGGVLVFLPGEGEIRRVAGMLDLPAGVVVRPLYGALPFRDQQAAIRPEAAARKVVLATSIAETSLTIEDVRVVVDAGRARRARFDPGTGMSRLVTEKVSRAEADQRRGRAGRVAEGLCYRMWAKAEEGGLPRAAPAEIEAGDLAGIALDLAAWGVSDPGELAFLSPPNPGVFQAARGLLAGLGALDDGGRVTAHGRALAGLPVHPRLGHMLLEGGAGAAALAALLEERDPMRGAGVDLGARLKAVERGDPRTDRGALDRIRGEAKRLRRLAGDDSGLSRAEMLALAYPDRVGLRRPGEAPRWVLSGGKGVKMAQGDALAGARLIVVAETDGDPREGTVRLAMEISEAEVRGAFGAQVRWEEVCHWSKREARVVARRQERLGAVVLDDRVWREVPEDRVAEAMLDGVRELGFRFSPAAERFRARVALVRGAGADLPDLSDAALMAERQPFVIDSQQVQQCRLQVMHVHRILHGIHTQIVRSAVGDPGFDAAPGQPQSKRIRMMIAAPAFAFVDVALQKRGTPEFAAPDHQGIFQHPTLLQVLHQRGGRLIGVAALRVQFGRDTAVLIPAGVH